MKRLLLLLLLPFIGNGQVFNFQTFDIQEVVIKNEDTTYSEVMSFVATYIFDIKNNTITASINGVATTMSVFCWIDTTSVGDSYAGLTYNDHPLQGWLINLTTKEVLFTELRLDSSDYVCKFPNSILTKL
jgi:hypothetical protein